MATATAKNYLVGAQVFFSSMYNAFMYQQFQFTLRPETKKFDVGYQMSKNFVKGNNCYI